MDGMAGKTSALNWIVHVSVVGLVLLWLFPTMGLLVSSFRTGDQITTNGWWASLTTSQEQAPPVRISGGESEIDGLFVIEGRLFPDRDVTLSAWGTSLRAPEAYGPGDVAELSNDRTVTVTEAGKFVFSAPVSQEGERLPRVFTTLSSPPEFIWSNYDNILGLGVARNMLANVIMALLVTIGMRRFALAMGNGEKSNRIGVVAGVTVFLIGLIWIFGLSNTEVGGEEGMAKAFFNTLTVTIPATIIPILIAAFAAYALAWMEFPGRALLVAAVVGLLVVPLQLALIPLLSLHVGAMELLTATMGPVDENSRLTGVNWFGEWFGMSEGDKIAGKGYFGAWLAHTGFGMPLAIYLLRNYMVGLPRDIIENAKVDGATDFQIFVKIILPLSFPALASFAIFQFLWTWNDLLVAMVFLIDSSGQTTVMTKQIIELLGTRGGDWEILATAAFISIAVPLAVFFLMQRYLVRGLLAGSVK